MAGSALLEKEIEKITGESQELVEQRITEEEREHRRLMTENFRRLIERDESYTMENARSEEPEAFLNRAPAYQYPDYSTTQLHAPVVPTSSEAPSASSRIADYLAANRTLETLRERSGEAAPTYENDFVGSGRASLFSDEYVKDVIGGGHVEDFVEDYAPTYEEELYRQGILMNTVLSPDQEPVAAPYYSPSYMPAENSYAEDEEDVTPTRRTMQTLERKEETQNVTESKIFAGLSSKTKIILAGIAATVIILLAVICINAAVLNSIRAGVQSRENTVIELSETLTGIESEIGDLTSPENIENWASMHGMTPPES